MDHKEAIRIQAVDRYLLGEMTAADRMEFEEHFFTCGECSEDLHMGAILVDNSRAVLREKFFDPVPASLDATPHRSGWSFWSLRIPLAVSIALVGLVGYQNLRVLPEYRRQLAENVASAVPPRTLLRPAVRGAVPLISLPKNLRFFEIAAEEVDPVAGGYHCLILDAQGKTVAGFPAPSVDPGEKLNILLDSRQTPGGQYTLVVRKSSDDSEVGRYPFSIGTN